LLDRPPAPPPRRPGARRAAARGLRGGDGRLRPAAAQRGRPGQRALGGHAGGLPAGAPRTARPQAARAAVGGHRRPYRAAPGQRPPDPSSGGAPAGLPHSRALGMMGTEGKMATDDAASGPPSSTLVDRLAEELCRRWRTGERPVVEDYLALYPELR